MASEFTVIEHELLTNKSLSAMEKLVYICIKRYAYNSTCFPSLKRLAADAGVCQQTVRRAVRGLEEKGFVTVKRRMTACGGAATNLYIINK